MRDEHVRLIPDGPLYPTLVIEEALTALLNDNTIMVRQPLLRAGNILARCDYRRIAMRHPSYPRHKAQKRPRARGTAGNPKVKNAFIEALRDTLRPPRGVSTGSPSLSRPTAPAACSSPTSAAGR